MAVSKGKWALTGVGNVGVQTDFCSVQHVLVEIGYSCMHIDVRNYCTNLSLKKLVMTNAAAMQGDMSATGRVLELSDYTPLPWSTSASARNLTLPLLISACLGIATGGITNGHKLVTSCSIAKWGLRIFPYSILNWQVFVTIGCRKTGPEEQNSL